MEGVACANRSRRSLLAEMPVIDGLIASRTRKSLLLLTENSKRQPERKLHLPRSVGGCCDAPHAARGDNGSRNLELGVIEHIKELSAKQQRRTFGDGELLLRRSIQIDFIGSAKYVPAQSCPSCTPWVRRIPPD